MSHDESGTDTVGYKRPPTATRFKPGQSGNPGGRPRRAASLSRALAKTASARIAVDGAAHDTSGTTQLEALLAARFRTAIRGNDKASAQILELCKLCLDDDPDEDGDAG